MTLAQYSKATDLRIEIQHYEDIIDLLKNSKGNYLATIKMRDESIMNKVHIMDEPIITDLVDVVQARINALEKEFNKL